MMPEFRYAPKSVVLHIPHSSRTIPERERPHFLLSDADLQLELLRVTDAYTDELFDCGETVERACHPVSRLVVDPERFENDSEESMSRVGMGVVYTRTSDARELRVQPSALERERLLAEYYRPHHQRLTAAVEKGLSHTGRCLIIDCHSFPLRPLPYELDQNPARPDICIGRDAFHTPPELVEQLCSLFSEQGYSVAVDRPFKGALVPAAFYGRNRNVNSVMIELNRALYMSESTGAKSSTFDRTKRSLRGVLEQAVNTHLTPGSI